ncbi:MAG: helix-turn-helix transcriptional regulator, partial [Actinomycetota bacterium]|nr:helix-turn-helix transcriptional regulator [Actinomycetota bacterium]
DSLATDLRRAVADDPAMEWTLAEAAARWHTSCRSFQRRLHAEGQRFAALVLEGRLDAAEALLRRTAMPVSAVSYLCGFADPAHLASVCRRLRGMPPSALRIDQ